MARTTTVILPQTQSGAPDSGCAAGISTAGALWGENDLTELANVESVRYFTFLSSSDINSRSAEVRG